MTNMDLVGYNKRFLNAAIGAPGNTHDSRLPWDTKLFNDISKGDIIPDR